MKKRILATILCMCMLIGLFPATVLASGGSETQQDPSTETLYVYSGEEFTVALPEEMGDSVTISGYNEAKDWYVTDGLVLHYDGIYNAGMGTEHDSRANTWVQLVEGAGGDLTISNQTWESSGLKVTDTAVGKSNLSSAITTDAEGMTVEQVFSVANIDEAKGKGGEYFYPLQVGLTSFGNVRPDGPVLNYVNKPTAVLNIGAIENSDFVTMALTSDGTETRASYRDGRLKTKNTLEAPIDDHYSFGSVSIPVNKIRAVDWTEENKTMVILEKTIYGLRIYNRELTADEIEQNADLDQARFEDKEYVTPGTVNGQPLLEYDYSEKEQSTTVKVADGSVELTLNELTDGHTLTFTDGSTSFTQNVVVMSEEDAKEADAVIAKIKALRDAGSVTADDEVAISAAAAAYELLNDQQKGRVGGERKDKLDACVAALDEQLAGKKTYELTYNLNDDGGVQAALPEGTPNTETVVYKGEPFTLAVPTRANYTFLGWWYGDTQITDGSGASLGVWTILSGGEIQARWERTEDLGTERNPYPISSAEQWYALARILKSRPASDNSVSKELKQDYAGFGYTGGYAAAYDALQTTYYRLQNNITLTPENEYFGVPNFKGTLDGANHTVTLDYDSLSVNVSSATQFGGLIQSSEHCVVKNLTLNGTMSGQYTATAGLQDIGVLIGATKKTQDANPIMEIENVTSNVTVDLTIDVKGKATSYLGAMIGRSDAPAGGAYTVLENCVNNGAITVTYLNANANTGRVGGLVGHAYPDTVMNGCKNYGDITHKGDSTFYIGGMVGSGNVDYQNCVQGGSIESPLSAVVPFPGMAASQIAGNLLEVKVTGVPGTSVTYVGGDTKQIGEDGTVTFQIPIYLENDAVENNAFSYNNYFTVNGVRLDFFSLTSRKFSATIQATDADDLRLPFQSENDALVITTAEQMLTLQKAINDGDQQSIKDIFASRGMNAERVGYDEARLALQSGYYKLGNDIALNNNGYTGIGTRAFPFGGHFNGGGHTITLTLSDTIEAQYVGVFGYVNPVGGSQPEIKSLHIISYIALDYDTRNNTTYCIGSLAGALGSSVVAHGLSDITVQVNKIAVTTSYSDDNSDTYYVGGVVGQGTVSNVNATVSGPITAEGKGYFYVAGVTGSGSVQKGRVTFQGEGTKISANSKDKNTSVAVLSAYSLADITFSDVTIENKTTEAVQIWAEGKNAGYAGGIVGYMPNASSNQVNWLRVDRTVQVIGKFEVSAGDNGYAGGLAGSLHTSYSADINGFINTMDVSGRYAGGLFGEVKPGGNLQTLTITDSLNAGKITGVGATPKTGALVGRLDIHTEPAFHGNAYLASSCDQVIGQVVNTEVAVEDSEAAAKLDLSVLEDDTHSYMGTVQLVEGTVPTALTLAPAEYFRLQDDGKLQFVKVGEFAAEFLWNGRLFYTSNPVTVSAKELTQDDVTITGISSSYPSDEAAQDALTSIEVVYEGHTLVEGTDYTVTLQKDNDTFTITFAGNFTGAVNKTYTVIAAAPDVTVENYIGIYDAAAHSISVSAPVGATVTYGESADKLSETNPSYTDAGTYVVYWKVESSGQSVAGSAVVEITPAHLTIKAHDKSAYVGDAVPVLGEDDYTMTGLVGDDTLSIKPTLAYESAPNMSKTGTYAIKASGADAGNNYTITYVDGTLTVTKRSSGGGSSSSGSSGSSSGDYTVSVDTGKHGTVTVSPKRADKGDTVTITVRPDKGYQLDELTVTDKSGDTVKLKDKGNGKFTFTMPGSKVTVEASFKQIDAEPEVPAFADVPADAYYADAVAWAVKEGITSGTSAATFTPNASCTRAQMVTFLWRANGSPVVNYAMSFADVPADAYYAEAVRWAVSEGITTGTTATTFSPNATVTRAQAVTFIYRNVQAQGGGFTGSWMFPCPFTDVPADAYYFESVQWCAMKNITSGTSADTFSPSAPCTRAQIVTFLYRDAQ